MSRHAVDLETRVEADPETVWAVLTDPKRFHEWMRYVEEAQAPKGVAEGAPMHIRMRLGSYELVSEATIVSAERPRKFEWRLDRNLLNGKPNDMIAEGSTRFDVVADGTGSKVLAHVDFLPHGIKARLGAGYLVNHYLKPQMTQALARLKDLVEAAPRPGGKPKKSAKQK